MCISMITHPRSDEDTVTVLRNWTEPHRSRDGAGLDPLQPDDDDARRRANAARSRRRHLHRRARCGNAGTVRPHARQGRRESPHSWRKYWEILEDARDIFGRAEIRRAHHRRHGRDRARHADAGPAPRRHGRPQPHVLLLPGEGVADGPSPGDTARPVAPRAARALPDRLPRRARRAHAVRRAGPRGGLRHSASRKWTR